jgi:hypothetical protein
MRSPRRPPRRPPDKKLLIGALVLLVAASAFASRPETSLVSKEVTFAKGN